MSPTAVNINVVQCQVCCSPAIETENLLLCTSIETNLWMSEHRL
jgi:hypothetical protein